MNSSICCPDDLGHRDVTTSEARDFAAFSKWRWQTCWIIGLQSYILCWSGFQLCLFSREIEI